MQELGFGEGGVVFYFEFFCYCADFGDGGTRAGEDLVKDGDGLFLRFCGVGGGGGFDDLARFSLFFWAVSIGPWLGRRSRGGYCGRHNQTI